MQGGFIMGIVISKEYFKFEELSEEAKDRAYYKWLDRREYPWARDNEASLYAFAEMFGVKIIDYGYGGGSRPYIRYETSDWDGYRLKGVRLWKFLMNNYAKEVEKDCPFTGYCMDEALLDPIRRFLERPERDTSLRDLVEESLNAWLHACERDHDDWFSRDMFEQEAEDLGMVFSADGSEIVYL